MSTENKNDTAPPTPPSPEAAPVPSTPHLDEAPSEGAAWAAATESVPLDDVENDEASPEPALSEDASHPMFGFQEEADRVFTDPGTAGGQALIALRNEFEVAAEKLFRGHLSPKRISYLDSLRQTKACAVSFVLGTVARR